MKRALQIYHLINLMHIAFYLYILVRMLDIANARALIKGNSLYILLGYALAYMILSYYAKKLGNGFENPMRTLKWPRILHSASIAIFVLAIIFVGKYNQWFLFVMMISFMIEILAFTLAYRGAVVKESSPDLLDDLDDDTL